MSFLQYLLFRLGSAWLGFNGWCDRNPRLSVTVLVIPAIILAALPMSGCGTTTDRQTKTVERTTTQTAPITLDTPVGQIVVQPTQVTVSREASEVEQERKTIDLPPVPPLLQAAASGFPFGPLIGGIVGAGGIAGALHQMLRAGKAKTSHRTAERQRDELIDGIERAKSELPDGAWETLRTHLEAEQSHDTKVAVKGRVG